MDKAHGYADKTIDEIEKELKEIYATAQKELAKKAEAYMNKFIAEDEKQRKLLDTGKLTEKEYQQWLKKKVMSGQRFTKMKEQCAEQLTHANEIALDHINDKMADVYAVSYNALEKDVKGLSGYSFHIVSPDTVKTLAGRDSSLLPYKKLDPAKDIPWNMKAINSEVLQGVLQGESVKAITKRVFGYTTQSGKDQAEIAHKMQVAAARTAQTLITAAENKGRQDSYDRAEKDGVIIEKEWIATIDHATRDSHRDLDGTSVPEDKPFDNGLMYPGDPSGRAEEVYNCRCTMAAIVKGFTSQLTGEYKEHTERGGAETEDEKAARKERETALGELEDYTEAYNIQHSPVNKLKNPLSDDEIIEKLSGADRTKGSCASLALSYCGNKAGLDVTDYRGGQSRSLFSEKSIGRRVIKTAGAELTIVDADTIRENNGLRYVSKLLHDLPNGEQYYVSFAQHAAIVRNDAEMGFQYLEMQSEYYNGWINVNYKYRDYGKSEAARISSMLRGRFGADGGYYRDLAIAPVSSFKATDEFTQALGYINTATGEQQKGAGGYAK